MITQEPLTTTTTRWTKICDAGYLQMESQGTGPTVYIFYNGDPNADDIRPEWGFYLKQSYADKAHSPVWVRGLVGTTTIKVACDAPVDIVIPDTPDPDTPDTPDTPDPGTPDSKTPPTINTVSVSDDNTVNAGDDLSAVVFSGTTSGIEDGQEITLDIGGVAATATVQNNAFSDTVDLSGVGDGADIAITATVSDADGNAAAPFAASFVKDTSDPSTPDNVLTFEGQAMTFNDQPVRIEL